MDNVIADYLLADFGSFVEKCASAGVDAYEFVGKVAQAAVGMSGASGASGASGNRVRVQISEPCKSM